MFNQIFYLLLFNFYCPLLIRRLHTTKKVIRELLRRVSLYTNCL